MKAELVCPDFRADATSAMGFYVSIQAMAWAIEQQEVTDPVTQLVLLCLANYAGAMGQNAYPGIARLARDTRLSERAVQKHLRKLEQMSIITTSGIAPSRADKRPRNYQILMSSRGAPNAPRLSATGCTKRPDGVNVVQERGERGAPNPSQRSVREPKSAESVREEWEAENRARFGSTASILTQSKRVKR
jgi:DNA-binding MarR family transcriptional regulator